MCSNRKFSSDLLFALWLNELRTNCEDYDFNASDYEKSINSPTKNNDDDDDDDDVDDDDDYRNIWECGANTSGGAVVPFQLKYASECRISTVFDEDCGELFAPPAAARLFCRSNDDGNDVPSDVLDWTRKLLHEYCSEDEDDFREYVKSSAEIDKLLKHSRHDAFPTTTGVELRATPSRGERYSRTTYHGGATKSERHVATAAASSNYVMGLNKIKVNGQPRKLAKSDKLVLDACGKKLHLSSDPTFFHHDDLARSTSLHSQYKKVEFACDANRYEITFGDAKAAKEFYARLRAITNDDDGAAVDDSRGGAVRAEPRRTLLQKFLPTRQPRELLEDKGIYKNEPVFGNRLENLVRGDDDAVAVPPIVAICTRIVERPANVRTQGIYRTSGNMATIQTIRMDVNCNSYASLERNAHDCDVICGTLKMFFRELREPLVGDATYRELLAIHDTHVAGAERHAAIKAAMARMPPAHRATLDYLLKHLARVIAHERDNCMSVKGMAIVWGPTLISQSSDFGAVAATTTATATTAIEQRNKLIEKLEMSNNVVEMLLSSYCANEDCTADERQQQQHQQWPAPIRSASSASLATAPDCCYKEASLVFGRPLTALKSHRNLPAFVQKIVPSIERHIKYPHLYDCRADARKLDKIKARTLGERLNYLDKFRNPELAVAFKEFFELLPRPLIARDLLDAYFADPAARDPNGLLRELLSTHLHPVERATLDYLLVHLINVIKMREHNHMDLDRVVAVWTPILCRDVRDDPAKYKEFVLRLLDLKHVGVNTMTCSATASMPELRRNNADDNASRGGKRPTVRSTKPSVYDNL